jgi:flagellar biosynthesis/type III secretory pathway chaperone
MNAKQPAANAAQLGGDNAENLIKLTDRLSKVMEREVELLRGHRANDIQALQTDKEALAGIYQRIITDLQKNPGALDGLDSERRERLKLAAARLHGAVTGNAIALRSAIEANHQLIETIAGAIRDQSNAYAPYMANGRVAHGNGVKAKQNLSVSFNNTL